MKNLFITVIGLVLIIAGFYYIEEIVTNIMNQVAKEFKVLTTV